ncbi:MAG: hypothetical protein FVQ85_00110 [Planctomycetes bacterium]|nr:hypothetical protein [Planctomycetota bacterium]
MIRQLLIVALTAGTAGFVCGAGGCSPPAKDQLMSGKTIEEVLTEHTPEWMATPGVVGTGIGMFEGSPCIRILSSVKPEQLPAKIPSTLEGYPVIIEETGEFRALDQE